MSKTSLVREDPPEASVSSIEEARRARHVEALSRAHGDFLRALARKLCRSHFDPDDLVQDVLVKTLRSPIPDGADERAWLARVMHNLFIDWIRRRNARREDALTEAVTPTPAAPEEKTWWQALTIDEVRATLARLPEEQRVTFEMFAFEGKSYDEIAAALGIAKATVGTRILRARMKIRDLLIAERGDG
jgi:RNA polymerase sigma-70 factor (ECF subfamily)